MKEANEHRASNHAMSMAMVLNIEHRTSNVQRCIRMSLRSAILFILVAAWHAPFVRIVTPANALSAGVPDSNKKHSRSLRLCGSIFLLLDGN
jgi:hypothetical protein